MEDKYFACEIRFVFLFMQVYLFLYRRSVCGLGPAALLSFFFYSGPILAVVLFNALYYIA